LAHDYGKKWSNAMLHDLLIDANQLHTKS